MSGPEGVSRATAQPAIPIENKDLSKVSLDVEHSPSDTADIPQGTGYPTVSSTHMSPGQRTFFSDFALTARQAHLSSEEVKDNINVEEDNRPWRERFEEKVQTERKSFIKNARLLNARGARLRLNVNAIFSQNLKDAFGEINNKESNEALEQGHWDFSNLIKETRNISEIRKRGVHFVSPNHFKAIISSHAVGPEVSPSLLLEEAAINVLEKEREITRWREKKIEYHPYSLNMHMEGEKIYIVLWNWFEDAPIVDEVYSLSDFDSAEKQQAIARMLYEKVEQNHKSFNFRRTIRKLPKLSNKESQELAKRIVYHKTTPKTWGSEEIDSSKASWRYLVSTFDVGVIAQPLNSETDRGFDRFFLRMEPAYLKVDRRVLRGIPFEPLEINGSLQSVAFEVDEKDRLELAKKIKAQGPVPEYYQDKYGNFVYPIMTQDPLIGDDLLLGIIVFKKYLLLESDKDKHQEINVGIDLSKIGFGDHPHLMITYGIPPQSTSNDINPYNYYSTLQGEDIKKGEGVYELASKHIKEVEGLLGFDPGTLVKSIFLIPSDHENASVQFTNPDSIFLWDEIFPALKEGEADSVYSHETFHTFDLKYSISDHPDWKKLFIKLWDSFEPSFFKLINESNFYEEEGGHSGDNALEFFATLMNTALSTHWLEKIKETSKRNRTIYYHSLKCLKKVLLDKVPDFEKSSYFAKLNQRIEDLEKIQSSENSEASYAPLSEILKMSVKDVLSQGPNPIKTIEIKEFRAEVLDVMKTEPVIVYVYLPYTSESAVHVKKIVESLNGKIKFVAMPFGEASKILQVFSGGVGGDKFYIYHQNGIREFPNDIDALFYGLEEDSEKRDEYIKILQDWAADPTDPTPLDRAENPL